MAAARALKQGQVVDSVPMHCRFCRSPMAYIHGHAACITGGCPMYGVNQAECCDGETLATCPAPTADVAAGPALPGPRERTSEG